MRLHVGITCVSDTQEDFFLDLIGVSRATKALQKTQIGADRTAACSAEDKV